MSLFLLGVGTLAETPFSVYKKRLWLALTMTIMLKYHSDCSVEFKKQAESVPVMQVNLVIRLTVEDVTVVHMKY